MLLSIVIGVAGLAIGVVIAWALSQTNLKLATQRAAQLESDLSQRASDLAAAQGELATARADLASQREQNARTGAERDAANQNAEKAANAIEEQRAEITKIRAQLLDSETERASLKTALEAEQNSHSDKLIALTDQFKALAGDILKENSKAFTEQNQTNIGQLLNPLKEKFEEFQKEVKSLNESGLTGRTQLKEQIENLAKLNTKLSDDANNLATALKGSSQTQGRWGEQLLETILETAGLRRGYEYLTQESFTREERTADGRLRAQLDVLVRLPEDRNIIIDSKVSLNAYDAYCSAQDDADRDAALKEHLKSVRNHILGLSGRDYHLLDGLNSPDFVVMFVPLEPAFILAISRESHLWQEAWDKNVLLVSPSTVLFVLRTVAQLWRQEQQTRSVQDIVRRGGELYDKLAAFAKDLTDVGKGLDAARSSYDEACKKLSTGKGNVIRQAELLKGMGVKPSKAIPAPLVEQAFDSEPLELAASESEE